MVAILRKLRDLANIDTPNLNLDGALVSSFNVPIPHAIHTASFFIIPKSPLSPFSAFLPELIGADFNRRKTESFNEFV
jgi:hypothetical protein